MKALRNQNDMRVKAEIEEKSRNIGLDYIIETTGEEFVDKNLYFVCLLCATTEAHSTLQSHLVSLTHRMQFLVSICSFNLNPIKS